MSAKNKSKRESERREDKDADAKLKKVTLKGGAMKRGGRLDWTEKSRSIK